ncbi:unnamed protein product [Cyprideis torosa]|uniref:Uncharacterized protein n=1 Tax=Cyprideis torosa TaxID=163714 RepID=A0A7R8WJN4_9CRUS|nr:unnamed protein product [Cyprideis torosa]CAG0902211.1 unnamed protein product [Cyprideis torosa]
MSVESLEGGLMVKQAVMPPSPFAPPLPPRHSPPSLLRAPRGRQGAPPAGRHARLLPEEGSAAGSGKAGLIRLHPRGRCPVEEEDKEELGSKGSGSAKKSEVFMLRTHHQGFFFFVILVLLPSPPSVANIPPELDTVDALEDLFAGYNLRSARPSEALVTLASMADAEAAAAFLEHMSFSTGQIKVTFEDDRGGAMASRPPPSPPSSPPLPLSRPPPLLGRGEIASVHQEGPQDVLVGKLPFGTTRRQVEDLFQDFQPREVEVFSGDTGIYAYLSFMEREAAESAVRAWNGKRYGDTRLLVEMYKERGATGRRV